MFRASCIVLLAFVAVGCSSAKRSDLAIYDWESQRASSSANGARDLRCKPQACVDPAAEWVYVIGAPKLTGDDVDRKTIRADLDPQTGEPVVYARFTPEGQRRFGNLTLALARRGARLRRPQHFLLVIDGAVYAAPYIDYRFNPNGIPADSGVQFSGLASLGETRELAKALRGS